jgi:hypothetical protein
MYEAPPGVTVPARRAVAAARTRAAARVDEDQEIRRCADPVHWAGFAWPFPAKLIRSGKRADSQTHGDRTDLIARRRWRTAAPQNPPIAAVTRAGCQGAAIDTELDQKMPTRLEHIGVAVPRCAARVLGKPIGVEPGRSLCVCADRATCASNQRMKSVHARPCRQPARQAYVLVRAGAPPGTRTPNPRIKSPLLCQLS